MAEHAWWFVADAAFGFEGGFDVGTIGMGEIYSDIRQPETQREYIATLTSG